ncbi:MAG: TerB N-terminal domain-containing protein [Lachnospiraceae bacterium]|nr:TerB N-terminal domain-containing protein [Lachnospiraceae bacterium]
MAMELSELVAFAKEKYQIDEQHKWSDFPGFSVLCHPETGKWLALLMRQWDTELGQELQRCDIKCGLDGIKEIRKPYLSAPIRMHGRNWVGVTFDESTEAEVIFQLFDRAVTRENKKGFTVVVDEKPESDGQIYGDTLLPFGNGVQRGFAGGKAEGKTVEGPSLGNGVRKELPKRFRIPNYSGDLSSMWDSFPLKGDKPSPGPAVSSSFDQLPQKGDVAPGEDRLFGVDSWSQSKDHTVIKSEFSARDVPVKILEMIRLYEYGDGSLSQKARNFYRQGKFMEDYEDDAPWKSELSRYLTTYHDLNIPQIRGYFTWRTAVRRGQFQPITASLAYMYLYELLCGIGTDSPEDTLLKMGTFEKEYIDVGFGNQGMRRNLRKWSLEYAVLHRLPLNIVLQYVDPAIVERDMALSVLRKPKDYTDNEVFSALATLEGKKLRDSFVLKIDEDKGKHLFSEMWRYLSDHYEADGRSIFAACFGDQRSYVWYPLANAVYYEEMEQGDREFFLNECRSYQLRDGIWTEKRYEELYFDRDKFHAIIHESDRLFRKYLKTGHYTKERPEEGWVTPYVQAVIEECKRGEIEAARPRIEVDFSGLERIRRDAIITRDSLLTEEDVVDNESPIIKEDVSDNESPMIKEDILDNVSPIIKEDVSDNENPIIKEYVNDNESPIIKENAIDNESPIIKEDGIDDDNPITDDEDYGAGGESRGKAPLSCRECGGLEPLHLQILSDLLSGQSVEDRIKEQRLMLSVVADRINEALFDDIGDNILECDDNRIILVEDYREDLIEVLGGQGE